MIPKILSGEKTIESRWYKTRRAPWDRIKEGEEIYFKNSGEMVTIKAVVSGLLQFSDLTPRKIREILDKFGHDDGIKPEKIPYFAKLFADKKYCLLVFLKNPRRVKPFEVDKTGFGAMSAWITVDSIVEVISEIHSSP